MWIVLSFGSAFFAGITAILAKIGIKNTDSHVATAIRTIVVLVFSWILVFMIGSQNTLVNLDVKSLLFLLFSGLTAGASWLCYFRALQWGDVNKVTPIDKSSTVLTMILAFILLGEPVTPWKLWGMILMGIGTYFMIAKQKTTVVSPKNNIWLLFAGLSAVFASLTSILGKFGMQNIESNLGTAIRTIVVLIMAWMSVFIRGKQGNIKHIDKKSWIFILFSGITTGMSWLCYYKALQDGQASIVVPIDKLSIVLTVMFASFVLKEKLSKKGYIGFVFIVIGTLLLLVRI